MNSSFKHENLKALTSIPESEQADFDNMVRTYRKKYIKKTIELVDLAFLHSQELNSLLERQMASDVVVKAREAVWQEFLISESEFNTKVMTDLNIMLKTPREIIEKLTLNRIINLNGENLVKAVMEICGQYSGMIFPYIYSLSLSNTQSRRTRSGSTFEHIIYKIYNLLSYPFDSQKTVGKAVFQSAGLGKMVDSILPSISCFAERRDKVVIGTMKTSLRERWQEVNEEIARTNVPKIYLLTVDDDISTSKAKQMANHNILVVALKSVAGSEKLRGLRNIISFEDYFFDEIPNYLAYWNGSK